MINLSRVRKKYHSQLNKLMADYPETEMRFSEMYPILIDLKIINKDGENESEKITLRDGFMLGLCWLLNLDYSELIKYNKNPYKEGNAKLIAYHNHLDGYERFVFEYEIKDIKEYSILRYNIERLKTLMALPIDEYLKIIGYKRNTYYPNIRITKNIQVDYTTKEVLELSPTIISYIKSKLSNEQLDKIGILDIAINNVCSDNENSEDEEISYLPTIITNTNHDINITQMSVIVTFVDVNNEDIVEIREIIESSLETLELSGIYKINHNHVHQFYDF